MGSFEKYREAWSLLDCSLKARGWKDIPIHCCCQELSVRCAVCLCRSDTPVDNPSASLKASAERALSDIFK
jgi:hypothetical protein